MVLEIDRADASLLCEDERSLAETYGPVRKRTFVAGRAAAREGLAHAGLTAGPITVGPRGEPAWDAPVSISISHKDELACAIVRPRAARVEHVGIDVERVRPPSVDISGRVLTDEEHLEYRNVGGEDARARYLLETFSMKEAIYKAIHPMLRRYVGFREVRLMKTGDDVAVMHALSLEARPLAIRVTSRTFDGPSGPMILSTALAWHDE